MGNMVCLRAGINIYRRLIFLSSISEIIAEFCVLSVVTDKNRFFGEKTSYECAVIR